MGRLGRYWLEPYQKIETREYRIKTPKWTADKPLRIGFLSDLHASTRFMPLKRVREAVAKVQALEADLILFGGDLMAEDNSFQNPLDRAEVTKALGELTAPLGTYAVMGNHDWWDDPATQNMEKTVCETADLLIDAGIGVLENQSVELGPKFWLAGLGCQTAFQRERERHLGTHDVPATLAGIPEDAAVVLLAHEPYVFPFLPQHIDLTLSGHTHGGQVLIFGKELVATSKLGRRYSYGHFQEGGRQLIVTSGLGCSNAPLRFGRIPEVLEITLAGPNFDSPS